MARYKCYTDDEAASILAAASVIDAGTRTKSRLLNVDRRTLRHWIKGDRRPTVRIMAPLKNGPLAERLEELAQVLVGEAYEERGGATFSQKMVAIGIAIDKATRLRMYPVVAPDGEPCSMNLTVLTEEQLQTFLGLLRLVTTPAA